MTSIFEHRDVVRTVLANFTRRDASAFLSTSRLVSRCARDPDCAWRLHTDIEEALARVRHVCDFGPDDFERNEGSGWRLCLQQPSPEHGGTSSAGASFTSTPSASANGASACSTSWSGTPSSTSRD